MPEPPAIIVLTPRGAELARRLTAALGGEVVDAQGRVGDTLTELFRARRPLICVMALGIVVRLVGPLPQDKETDPPVVVIDEAGRFAVSVLGGHGGGANELARRAAQAIGAIPVITTASDALGLPALDLLGREWGWRIERSENLTPLMAALVRGGRIAVLQEAGRTDWWPENAGSLQRVTSWPLEKWDGLVVIGDRIYPENDTCPTVFYRPRSLVLGVGCRRGVPADEIDAHFQRICRDKGFSPLSLGVVATAELKADEPGLIEFADRQGVPLVSFSLADLAAVPDLPTPSAVVKEKIGVFGVAEPAALLAARTDHLLVPKQQGRRVTMALARREDA